MEGTHESASSAGEDMKTQGRSKDRGSGERQAELCWAASEALLQGVCLLSTAACEGMSLDLL